MTEQELRTLVRDVIARHAAGAVSGPRPSADARRATAPLPVVHHHASHALFAVTAGAESGGPCLIEPAVPCTHCGYCQSYGH